MEVIMALIRVIQQKEMINDSNRMSIYLPLLLMLLAMLILTIYMAAVSVSLSSSNGLIQNSLKLSSTAAVMPQ
jgi:hypothetical protein